MVNAAAVPKQSDAFLGISQSKFFVDRIKPPSLDEQRIGKRRNLGGRFVGWITTESDIPAWAQNEWRAFLARHRQLKVDRVEQCDYIVTCDIEKLAAGKKYDAVWNDDFDGHATMTVVIRKRLTGEQAFSQRVSSDYAVERLYDDNDTISDDEMFNRCFSMAFQKALEQIDMRVLPGKTPATAKPSPILPGFGGF